MSFFANIEDFLNAPLTSGIRSLIALLLSPMIFFLGIQKYSTNDLFMPIWKRDYSSLLHGLTGLGHTETQVTEVPVGVVGFIAAVLVGFMVLKGLAKYPMRMSFHLFGLLVLDFMVVSTLINIFFFSGSSFDVIYYGGAFIAGIYFFGDRVTSQLAMIGFVVLVLVRLVYIDSMYIFMFWIPIMTLVYIILRAPFESENYRSELQNFSFNKMIGRN